MQSIKFKRDYMGNRRGDVVTVEKITKGLAHILVARGWAEYVEASSPSPDPPPRRRGRPPKKKQPERAIREAEEYRDGPTDQDTASD